MFDTTLIITLFLLAPLRVCLLTLRFSINIKHLCLVPHSFPILTDFLKSHPLNYFILRNLATILPWPSFTCSELTIETLE